MTPPALFLPHRTESGDHLLLPSEFARSVWSLDLVHGAATAALLARTAETALRPGLRIARLTVDLMRPIPLQPLEARATIVRDGKRIQVIEASLFLRSPDGEAERSGDRAAIEVGRATALALLESDLPTDGVLEFDAISPPDPQTLQTTPAEIPGGGDAYHTTVEWRLTEPWGAAERPAVWIRNPAQILPGEPLSPVARAVASADALSPLANYGPAYTDESMGFINPDITLYLHREPRDEWLCVSATSRQGGRGYSIADGALHDRCGPVGRIVLATLAQTRRPDGLP